MTPAQLADRLPVYQSHKKVRASQIAGVGPKNHLGRTEIFVIEGSFLADEKMTARYHPQVGDYLVVYDDGYISWSPAQAFEEGYSKIA